MLADFTQPFIELFRDLAMRYHLNIVGGSQFELCPQGSLCRRRCVRGVRADSG
jgi:hypothetical protein